jgi:hypothetical protein
MSNEFDLLHHEQASTEADAGDVAHKPGKHANTDFVGTGQMGPLPLVPGKRAATEALPFELVHRARQSPGQHLPSEIQQKLEASIGADFSKVTVHTGPASEAATSALAARAYADGQQIHFAPGEYDPSSPRGQQLIAHEAAHVVQARGGTPTKQISDPSDHAEREADAVAKNVMLGVKNAALSTSGTSAVMRKRKDEGDQPLPPAPPDKAPDTAPKAVAGQDVKVDPNGKKADTALGAKNKTAPVQKDDPQDVTAAGDKGGKETKAADANAAGGKGKDAAAAGKGAAKGAHKDAGAKPGGAKHGADAIDAGGKDKHVAPLYDHKAPAPVDTVDAPSITTIPAPQLDKPLVTKHTVDTWVKQTGRTPSQHHDQIVAAITELTTQAQTMQNELVTLSDTLQQRVTKDIGTKVATFTSSVTAPGRARVIAAYGGMGKTVEDSAQGALKQLATHKATGKAQIAA